MIYFESQLLFIPLRTSDFIPFSSFSIPCQNKKHLHSNSSTYNSILVCLHFAIKSMKFWPSIFLAKLSVISSRGLRKLHTFLLSEIDLRFLFRILIYLNVIFFFKILVLFHCMLCLRKPSSFHSHRIFSYYTVKSIFKLLGIYSSLNIFLC